MKEQCVLQLALGLDALLLGECLQVGFPVLLKATGGGGGIGIYICLSKDDLVKNFEAAGRYG